MRKWLQHFVVLIFSAFFPLSYSKVLEQKEELEQKHLHLLQILDSERQAKWHYVQQTEELACEVKKLKEEVSFTLGECSKVLHVCGRFQTELFLLPVFPEAGFS